eukprot:467179-Pelagomonas_calceolata.AAC.1
MSIRPSIICGQIPYLGKWMLTSRALVSDAGHVPGNFVKAPDEVEPSGRSLRGQAPWFVSSHLC